MSLGEQVDKLHLYFVQEISKDIFKDTNLEELYFWHGGFTVVPAFLCKLPRLTQLFIGSSKLKSIAPEIFRMPLVSLGFVESRLTCVPKQIGQMLTLRRLDLPNNLLERFDRELCQLTNLTNLCLSDNRLKALPQEFGNLVSLVKLDLHANPLSSLPSCGCTKLIRLDISETLIEKLPRSMRSIKLETFLAEFSSFSNTTNLNWANAGEIDCPIVPSRFFYTTKADMWMFSGSLELGYINLTRDHDEWRLATLL